MIRVLFVCLGNICRSPMAEAVMRHRIEQEGLANRIAVDSAATSSWHIGDPPHQGTVGKLTMEGISTIGMKGRQLQREDFERFEYVIGMDQQNVTDMQQLFGRSSSEKMFRFLDLTDQPKDVPDPYYTGDFEETYSLVTDGCNALLEKIKADYFLNEA